MGKLGVCAVEISEQGLLAWCEACTGGGCLAEKLGFCLNRQSVPMTSLRKLQGEHVSDARLALLVDQVLILHSHTQKMGVKDFWKIALQDCGWLLCLQLSACQAWTKTCQQGFAAGVT